MPTFVSDGVTLAYRDEGEGKPVLLIHGYASNAATNWAATSWLTTITRSGRRAIAIDNRGHGASEKLYAPQDYLTETMAADAVRLLDHLGIERSAVMGYSMGTRIAAFMALAAPERISVLVLSGLAANLIRGVSGGPEIAAAMEAESAASVADPGARGFRVFAEQTKSDLAALAACIRVSRTTLWRRRSRRSRCRRSSSSARMTMYRARRRCSPT